MPGPIQPEPAWHRDFPNRYLSGERSDFLWVMICLDGMTENGGATRFVPGSHRLRDEDAIAEHRQGIRHRLAQDAGRAALCERGDIVLIHPKVLHGSRMNRTTTPRRNLVLQVGVEGAALSGEPEAMRDHRPDEGVVGEVCGLIGTTEPALQPGPQPTCQSARRKHLVERAGVEDVVGPTLKLRGTGLLQPLSHSRIERAETAFEQAGENGKNAFLPHSFPQSHHVPVLLRVVLRITLPFIILTSSPASFAHPASRGKTGDSYGAQ